MSGIRDVVDAYPCTDRGRAGTAVRGRYDAQRCDRRALNLEGMLRSADSATDDRIDAALQAISDRLGIEPEAVITTGIACIGAAGVAQYQVAAAGYKRSGDRFGDRNDRVFGRAVAGVVV